MHLAQEFAELQEASEFKECLFVSLDKWLREYHHFLDVMERINYVTILQNILFPLILRSQEDERLL